MKTLATLLGVVMTLMLIAPVDTHAQNKSRAAQIVTFSVLRTVTAENLSEPSPEKKITVAAVINGRGAAEAVSVPSAFLTATDFRTEPFRRGLHPESVVVTISD